MFTVYFDTNFFVWLRKADEALATNVIDSLNSLNVRHVLSEMLSLELLANADCGGFDKTLVERMGKFKLPPYCTKQNLTWEGLLPAPERSLVSELVKTLDSLTTEANSHAIVANRISEGRIRPEQIDELNKATQPFLEQHGLLLKPDNREESLRSIQAFAERMIGNLKDILPDGSISGELEWSDDPLEDSKMLGLLKPEDLERAKESNRLKDSITNSDNRPYEVAAGIADDRSKSNLAHSFRDSEHMNTFIQHRSEIDVLQIDKAQMNLLKRPKPKHRLVELNLSARCFTASSLQEVVGAIKRLKEDKVL